MSAPTKDAVAVALIAVLATLALAITVVTLVVLVNRNRPAEVQLQRVTKDGQECIVVERRGGRIEGVDCNWNGR